MKVQQLQVVHLTFSMHINASIQIPNKNSFRTTYRHESVRVLVRASALTFFRSHTNPKPNEFIYIWKHTRFSGMRYDSRSRCTSFILERCHKHNLNAEQFSFTSDRYRRHACRMQCCCCDCNCGWHHKTRWKIYSSSNHSYIAVYWNAFFFYLIALFGVGLLLVRTICVYAAAAAAAVMAVLFFSFSSFFFIRVYR